MPPKRAFRVTCLLRLTCANAGVTEGGEPFCHAGMPDGVVDFDCPFYVRRFTASGLPADPRSAESRRKVEPARAM